jgi:PAS domain S-box-containing protein
MNAQSAAGRQRLGQFSAGGEVYRQILAHSSEAIAIIDLEGKYLEQNVAHRDLIGYSDEELAGRTPAIHLGERAFSEIARELARSGRYAGEVSTRTKAGQPLTLDLSAFAVRDARGKAVCYVGIKRDITARKQAEQEQRLRYDQRQMLYRITEAVGRADRVEEIYEEALAALERSIGAQRASILLFDADGVMRFKAWRGISAGYRRAVEGHSPWSADTVDAKPITIADVAAEAGLGEIRETILREGIRALGFFPLVSRGRLLGKFMVYFDTPQAFSAEAVQLAQTIASHVAFSILKKQDVTTLKRGEEVQRFLAEAGNVLAASLDEEATIARLASLTIPFLADYCLIDAVEADGSLRRIATAHVDPKKAQLLQELERYPPRSRAARHPVIKAVRTGLSQFESVLRAETLRRIAADAEHRRVLDQLRPCSWMTVPMVARGRRLGALTLARSESQRHYSTHDLVLAEELARRAALAVDNARLYEAASTANRAKADFLAVMSHELRTPLNAILGYTELLEMGVPQPLPAESRRPVERIGASARHLLQIIEQILAFSRLDVGREEVQPVEVDVVELARDAAALIQPLSEQKGLRFTISLPSRAIVIRTDPGKLRQILLNLLSNAIKFTEAGSVGLSVVDARNRVNLRVRDSGIGIPAAQLELIFEPFWQGDRVLTRASGGTGLGLSVTRQLAELLGGEVRVESQPGEGSTFNVQLPKVATRSTLKAAVSGSAGGGDLPG